MVAYFPSDFKEEWNSQLSNANLSSSFRPGIAGGFIITSHGHNWAIYNSYNNLTRESLRNGSQKGLYFLLQNSFEQ